MLPLLIQWHPWGQPGLGVTFARLCVCASFLVSLGSAIGKNQKPGAFSGRRKGDAPNHNQTDDTGLSLSLCIFLPPGYCPVVRRCCLLRRAHPFLIDRIESAHFQLIGTPGSLVALWAPARNSFRFVVVVLVVASLPLSPSSRFSVVSCATKSVPLICLLPLMVAVNDGLGRERKCFVRLSALVRPHRRLTPR